MQFNKVIILVIGIFSVMTGCGTGFVDGWKDNDKEDSGLSPAQFCEMKDGYSWVNEACQKDSGLNLNDVGTEAQCKNIRDAFWTGEKCLHFSALVETQCGAFPELIWQAGFCNLKVKANCEAEGKFYKDGQCEDRPVVTFKGVLTQYLVRSGQLQPVEYSVTEGAVLTIANPTCEGFFALAGGKVVSSESFKVPENQAACEADLVGLKKGVESLVQKIKVTFSDGFQTYCADPDVDGAILYLTLKIMDALDAPDCAAAVKSLAQRTVIKFTGDVRISRLEPLAGLANVRMLEITGSTVEDLAPLASLTGLNWLDLSLGNVQDINALAGLKNLKHLFLENNPIAKKTSKTEKNCPTTASTNEAVRKFCLDK